MCRDGPSAPADTGWPLRVSDDPVEAGDVHTWNVTIQLDPMHVMMQSANGTNVMGEVGGGYYFMHTIPPHTPKTQLPISVTGAPAGGARAELHQPRLWSNFYGGR